MAELYHSYLLRLRYVDNVGQPTWLITVEHPGQGTQERFSDLTALVTFLHHTMALVDTGLCCDELHRPASSRTE